MKVLKILLGGLLGILLLLVVIAFFLPREYRVERSVVIAAEPATVFDQINNLRNWKSWMVWIKRDPNMTVEYEGPEAGVDAKQTWRSESEGSGELTITESRENREVRYDLAFPDMGTSSVGALLLEPVDNGVKVTWSDEGDLGYNPVFRYFGLFLDSLIGRDFEAGLQNLKTVAESQPVEAAEAEAAPAEAAPAPDEGEQQP